MLGISTQDLDYETALRCLCQEYLEFELYFGSSYSHADASKAIKKKLSRALTTNGIQQHRDQVAVEKESVAKRKHAGGDDEFREAGEATATEPSKKKQKTARTTKEIRR